MAVKPVSWFVRILMHFLVLPLIGALVFAVIIGRAVGRFSGPKKYFVCVVGDETDRSNRELMEQVLRHFNSDLDGVPLETEILNDYGDPEKADRIAEDLQRRNDVLMVVGHGSSTTSQRALRRYLRSDPPIPVILTTETNPGLYNPPAPNEDRIPPVFRLFPTDENQALVAADFIANKEAKSVWVVVDTSINPTYAQYLTRQFLNDVYERHPSLKVILWSNYANLPPNAIDKLGIEWVFFAGEWRNALVLVRQLSKLQKTNKAKVLLSDKSADSLLLSHGGADVAGVYVLHPLAADVFSENGYRLVGREASMLASALIDNVHQQFSTLARSEAPIGYTLREILGLHRVSDSRRAMALYMTTAVHNQITFSSSDVKITMKQDDNRAVVRKGASFHIWRIDQCEDHCKFVEPAY